MLCTGVGREINLSVGSVPPEARVGHTGLDQLLNAAAVDNLDAGRATAITNIATEIERVCRGQKCTPHGVYVPEGGR